MSSARYTSGGLFSKQVHPSQVGNSCSTEDDLPSSSGHSDRPVSWIWVHAGPYPQHESGPYDLINLGSGPTQTGRVRDVAVRWGPEQLGPAELRDDGLYVETQELRDSVLGPVTHRTVYRIISNDPRLREGFCCPSRDVLPPETRPRGRAGRNQLWEIKVKICFDGIRDATPS